ncbi:MAG TPA: c-type cytochrome [Candidatus Aquilonibacter sp.]|nr:c-type cytochrome [Candidatus Aquilonibacter sp.]
MKSLFFACAGAAAVFLALLGAGTPPPPAEMSAPSPAPSVSASDITSPTEPPVLYNAPKTPKGTPVTPKPSKAVPSYTADQARAGQTLFYEHCAECHGASGQGNYGPGLLTQDGNVQWQPVYYVFSYMRQHMPAGDAGALRQDEYIDIMAFMLKSHGHPAGNNALTNKTLMDSGALLGMEQPK